MSRLLAVLLLCALLGSPSTAVQAGEEETPAADDVRARVAAWLEDLKASAFEVREAARAGLEREGLRARDLLEAAAGDEDAEVRRTVAGILARVSGAQREAVGDVTPGDFEKLGLIALRFEQEPLAQALTALGARMGAQFRLPAGLPEGLTVTRDADPLPCFEALEAVLEGAGLAMPTPFDGDGAGHLLAGDKAPAGVPADAAGPLRLRLQEVTATRVFDRAAQPRYLVKLRLDWAPFVQVAQHSTPRITSAFDPDGKAFLPTPAMTRTVRRGVSTRSRTTTVDLHLMPGKEPCKAEIGVLEFTLPLVMRYDVGEVVLADATGVPRALGTDGKPAGRGQDESVTFHSLTESPEGRGQWILDYSALLADEVAQRTVQAFVREKDGALSQFYVAGGRSRSADGTVRITARAYRSDKGRPPGVVIRWYRREEAGSLLFRLENIPLR